MDTLVKKAFVKQVLQEEAKRFNKSQTAAIRKLLAFHTNRLDTSREQHVSGGNDLDGELTLTIPGYGRVLDIKPKNRKQSTNLFRLQKRRSRRKAYPIYNRYTFGHYNAIAYKLMYGLTAEVAEGLKKQFTDNLS